MRRLRKYVYYFGLFIGFSFFGWQFIKTINSNSSYDFTLRTPSPLVPAILLMVITFGIQYLNWKIMLDGFGLKLTWLDISKGYSISFVSRYIPGTIWGYFSRSEWMYKNFGITYSNSGAASIIEIIVTLTAAFLVIGLIGLLSPMLRISSLSWTGYLITLPFVLLFLIYRFVRIKEFQIFKRKVVNPIWNIPKQTWVFTTLISIVQWILYGLILWLVVISIMDPSFFRGDQFSNITAAIFAFALAWSVGFLIPFIPGGLGIREMSLTLVLIVIYNLPFEVSSIISILMRLITSVVEICWMVWGILSTKANTIRK